MCIRRANVATEKFPPSSHVESHRQRVQPLSQILSADDVVVRNLFLRMHALLICIPEKCDDKQLIYIFVDAFAVSFRCVCIRVGNLNFVVKLNYAMA